MSHNQDTLKNALQELDDNLDVNTDAIMPFPSSDEKLHTIEKPLRHKASMFSCYAGSEEKEQRLSKKETKTKKVLKKIFGF